MALQNIAVRRSNNYNLIRLILALIVAFGHGAVIFDLPLYLDLLKIPAVGLFFFISGIFVSQSLVHSSSKRSFIKKRVARIYPAAWFVILLSIFVLGIFTTSCEWKSYLSSQQTFAYLLENATLFRMEFFHDCLFDASPLSNQVNASLWSLQYEVVAYSGLMIIGIFGLTKRRAWLNIILIGLIMIHILSDFRLLPIRIPGFIQTGLVMGTFFMLGVTAYFTPFEIKLKWSIAIICVISLLVLTVVPGLQVLTIPLYCYLILFIGSGIELPKIDFIQRNDLSYGIYLIHFPVFQSVQSASMSPIISFGIGLFVMVVVAYISWKFIEYPSIRFAREKIDKL